MLRGGTRLIGKDCRKPLQRLADGAHACRWAVLLLVASCLLSACEKPQSGKAEMASASASAPAPVSAPARLKEAGGAADSEAASDADAQPRYVAVRHSLQVVVAVEHLADAWTAVSDQCARLDCVLLSSSLQREMPSQAPGAELEMRVAPRDLPALLGSVNGAGKVSSHATSSEDKTAQVVDVQAHIKNRTGFRDSLRDLLQSVDRKRPLADVLEIQSTLSQTQAELDSFATQLKLLQQETQRQFVSVRFLPQRTLATGSVANPVWRAMQDAGEVMSESLASVITFLAALLPWLIVILPLLWLLRWFRRRWSGRRVSKPTVRQPETPP